MNLHIEKNPILNTFDVRTSTDEVVAAVVDEANAEFIVRACNAHDELLEACKDALNLLEECPTVTRESIPYDSTMWQQKLRAAIAKAA